MEKQKLFIDFDGVIVDTIATIVSMYNYDYNLYSDFKKIDPNEVVTWNFEECTLASKEEINHYFNTTRFFNNIILMKDALQSLIMLNTKYDITIVSHGYSPNLRGKEKFIKNVFPWCKFIGVNLKYNKDKSCVDMSDGIFIDDSDRNLMSSNAKQKIIFGKEYSWNKQVNQSYIRLLDWETVCKELGV